MDLLLLTNLMAFVGPLVVVILAKAQRLPNSQALLWTKCLGGLLMLSTLLVNVIPYNVSVLGVVSLPVTLLSALGAGLLTRYLDPLRGPVVSKDGNGIYNGGFNGDHNGRDMVLTLALGGFLVHAMADGAALFSFAGPDQVTLGPALILDRLAVGFFVWCLIAPDRGFILAFSALILMSLVTWGGYHLMAYVSNVMGNPKLIGWVQSVLAGLVLQLVADDGAKIWRQRHTCGHITKLPLT